MPSRSTLLLTSLLGASTACALPAEFSKVAAGGAGGATSSANGGAGGGGAGQGGGGGAPLCPPFQGNVPNDCQMPLLIDANDCCVMGRSCGGGACNNGMCAAVEIVAAAGEARSLVLVADHVMWTDGTNGGQIHAALQIGSGRSTLASALGNPQQMASDGTWAYYTDGGTNLLRRVDLSATEEDVATAGMAGQAGVGGRVAVDGGQVFFAMEVSGGIWAAPANAMAAPASSISAATEPNGVVVDPNYVFWTERSSGTIMRRARDQSTVTEQIASGQDNPGHLAQDSSDLFFVTDSALKVVLKDAGSTPIELFAATLPEAVGGRAVVVDDLYVYWVTVDGSGSGSVKRMVKWGPENPIQTMATGLPAEPTALADDCTHLYVALSNGAILRITK